jgi:hypothetical protein
MRTASISLLLFSLLAFNCTKQKADLPKAIRDLISSSKNCACIPFVDKYSWRNQTVYLSSCAGPACDCLTVYYDESGIKFNMDSGYMPGDFRAEAQLLKNVWRCEP